MRGIPYPFSRYRRFFDMGQREVVPDARQQISRDRFARRFDVLKRVSGSVVLRLPGRHDSGGLGRSQGLSQYGRRL